MTEEKKLVRKYISANGTFTQSYGEKGPEWTFGKEKLDDAVYAPSKILLQKYSEWLKNDENQTKQIRRMKEKNFVGNPGVIVYFLKGELKFSPVITEVIPPFENNKKRETAIGANEDLDQLVGDALGGGLDGSLSDSGSNLGDSSARTDQVYGVVEEKKPTTYSGVVNGPVENLADLQKKLSPSKTSGKKVSDTLTENKYQKPTKPEAKKPFWSKLFSRK